MADKHHQPKPQAVTELELELDAARETDHLDPAKPMDPNNRPAPHPVPIVRPTEVAVELVEGITEAGATAAIKRAFPPEAHVALSTTYSNGARLLVGRCSTGGKAIG